MHKSMEEGDNLYREILSNNVRKEKNRRSLNRKYLQYTHLLMSNPVYPKNYNKQLIMVKMSNCYLEKVKLKNNKMILEDILQFCSSRARMYRKGPSNAITLFHLKIE